MNSSYNSQEWHSESNNIMFRLDFGRFLESGQQLVIEPISCYQAGKVWTNNT